MFWDFFSLVPGSIHNVSRAFSDRGVPVSYRHINGFPGPTYRWVNKGVAFWVEVNFKTDTGIKSFLGPETDEVF
jgi:catalase